MGLDIIEIFVAVQNQFRIEIDNNEAAGARTVGDLHRLILTKIPRGNAGNACLIAAAFYRLRLGLIEVCNAQRSQIRPSTPLARWMPGWRRRRIWRRLEASMRLRLPPLEYSAWAKLGILAVGLCAAVSPFAFDVIPVSALPLFASLALITPLACIVLARLAIDLAVAFPDGHNTVGQLARDVLARNYTILAAQSAGGAGNPVEVWNTLTRLIAHQLQIDASEIRPEDEFGRDLGAD